MDNVIKLFIKYVCFLIPFTIGTLFAVYAIVQVTIYPSGLGDIAAGFGALFYFLFGIIIGAALQISKNIINHEFKLSKFTIFIIIIILLLFLYYSFPILFPGVLKK